MPVGLDKIKQNADQAAKRQADFDSGASEFKRYMMLKNGDTARVRFLEEGASVWFVHTHELPKKPGQQFADKILCADQALSDVEANTYADGSRACYACQMGVKRGTKVLINLIRFDEPKLTRDAQGGAVKDAAGNYVFDGTEPALLIWDCSQTLGGRLAYLESVHGPLSHHICTVHKTGDKNNMYMVDIVEPNKSPEPWEHALLQQKIDPPKAIQLASPKFRALPLLSYPDMQRAYANVGVASGFQPPAPVAPTGNTYADAMAARNAGGHVNPGALS